MFVLILFISFLTTSALNQQKHCVNCKFFLLKNNNPYNWNLETNPNYGKCSLFPKQETTDVLISDLISSSSESEENINYVDFKYCTTARSIENMCGKEGRFYKTKRISKKQKCFFKVRKMIRDYFEEDY